MTNGEALFDAAVEDAELREAGLIEPGQPTRYGHMLYQRALVAEFTPSERRTIRVLLGLDPASQGVNRDEAVERAARVLHELDVPSDRAPYWDGLSTGEQAQYGLDAIAALDASGYPAALDEAIEILREQGHEERRGHKGYCIACRRAWPCRTARFLAEHDETT